MIQPRTVRSLTHSARSTDRKLLLAGARGRARPGAGAAHRATRPSTPERYSVSLPVSWK